MDTSIEGLVARRAELIGSLSDEGRGADLRHFAIWCAEQTDAEPGWRRDLIGAARGYASGELSLAEMLDIRNRFAGTAMAASVVGLNHGAANAAAFLSVWQTTRQSEVEAAVESARMAAMWAWIKSGRDGLGQDPGAVARQVEWLEVNGDVGG